MNAAIEHFRRASHAQLAPPVPAPEQRQRVHYHPCPECHRRIDCVDTRCVIPNEIDDSSHETCGDCVAESAEFRGTVLDAPVVELGDRYWASDTSFVYQVTFVGKEEAELVTVVTYPHDRRGMVLFHGRPARFDRYGHRQPLWEKRP